MASAPIRVATAVLSGRIFVDHPASVDGCHHNYIREYRSTSTTSGHCRRCGTLTVERIVTP